MDDRAAFDESRFTRLVCERGLVTEDASRCAIQATLEAFGSRVPCTERETLSRALPPALANAMSHWRYRGDGTPEDLYAAVARREPASRGFAREHVHIVLRAMVELLPDELVSRIEHAISPSIAELLRGFDTLPSEPPPHTAARSSRHHTLASGRPGSQHPLSESSPRGMQAESVASENPHGDTKLSSTHGETQEREHESLATAEPRAERTIAESHD